MQTQYLPTLELSNKVEKIQKISYLENIRDYYETTGRDYLTWSKNLNMHFGYWRWGMSPFRREPQLKSLAIFVISHLGVKQSNFSHIGDFGCGYATTARCLAIENTNVEVSAITIVPSQIREGNLLNEQLGLADRVKMIYADYTDTGIATASLDAAYAIESACHDSGEDKIALLTEMVRTLKPGATLVIADGFRTSRQLPKFLHGMYRKFCEGWALPEMLHIEPVKARLLELGCDEITFTDISWRVAPSVAHIPWVATKHTICELWRGRGKLESWRKKHIEASVITVLLGLGLPWFRYGVLTAKKK